jgi:hypothetical protein
VSDGSLIFLQQFPFRRIGQGIAQVIHRGSGGGVEEEGEEETGEDPWVKMRRDHGLDFRLFNTMLAEC